MTYRSTRHALVFAILTVSGSAAAQPSPVSPEPGAPDAPAVTPEAAARTVALDDPSPEANGLVRGGLTADEAAARALANAPSVARAEAAVRSAEAGSMTAFASVLPRLNLVATATYTNNIHNVIATFNVPYYRSRYDMQAQLSYPVTGSLLTALPLYRAAGLAAESAQLQEEVDLSTVALRAREAFYEHVRARGALVVAGEARDAVLGHREQVRALVEAGVAARADLLQIEAQVASAEVAMQNAQLGVDISARALGILITGDDEEMPRIEIGEDVSIMIDVPTDSLAVLAARALDQRPHVRLCLL
jgi:multidrug efflux system outer membrane protein